MFFSQIEYEERWARTLDAMRAQDLETVVIWGRTASTFDRAGDVIYLSNYFSSKVGQGFDAGPFNARAYCAVILRQGDSPILVADDPDVHSGVVSVRDVRVAADPIAMVVATLSELGIRGEIGFVGSDFFPVKYWHQLREAAPHLNWRICDDLVRRVRMVKSPAERQVIRHAGEISTIAMNRLMEALIGGQSEAEAAAEAAHAVISNGGVIDKIQVSLGDTIAYTCGDPLTGYRLVHPRPGDLLRAFVIGPFYGGYYLDPGRSAVCGNRPSPDQSHLLTSCAKIVEAVAAAVRPGIPFSAPAQIGDRLVADFGPDEDPAAEKFPFFGHPHGLYFEGPPYISTSLPNDAVFEEGMLIGVEAFLAKKHIGNVGFEQNYLVTADGVELVTKTPLLWH